MTAPKPGDRVATLHDCESAFAPDGIVRHDVHVLVTAVDRCTVGLRIRGVRCDGTRIEWIHEPEVPP